jgi:transcription elongation factor
MSNTSRTQKPRFQPGDHVAVTTPGLYRDKQGVVTEVSQPLGDFVYRYRVQLADGISTTFFGFELRTLSENKTA